MNKRRIVTLGLAAAMCVSTVLAGCGNTEQPAGSATNETQGATTEATAPAGAISVVSREDGSGTRGAFVELLGIEQKNEAGEKVDYTTLSAEITNSTAVMMTTVAGNANAIGYISLGSLNDDVKAVSIDGVVADVETVKDGTYPVARPFNIVYNEADLDDTAKDFIAFILSADGQAIVEEEGYVSQGNAGAYTAAGVTGEITVGGSSSVTPVMEKLAEAYEAANTGVTVEVQMTDSTTGIVSASEGVCDIGMASRAIKDEEKSLGLTEQIIAMDGIAVIVNNSNGIENLTSEQVRDIFMGQILNWEETAN